MDLQWNFKRCLKMSKDLEAVKKKRRFLRKSLTDTVKSVDEALSQQDNHARIQVLKDNIASKWSDLQEVQGTMCTMLEDADIDAECESHNEYEGRVIESMAKMTSYLSSKHLPEVKLAGSNPHVSQSSSQVQVKLPKINLPTFDGNVLSWQPYYQSIKVSVVDNASLADVQKLEYLMRSLKGSAAEAVKGFAVVQANYQPVLEILKERFGHTRLILDAHVRSLIHLPRLSCDDAASMRKFYDEVIGHVRSVESMGEKFKSETLAPVLVPLIVDKLPKEVVEKWELELSEEIAKQDCVEVKTLFTFLEQLIRAKESSQPPSLDSKAPAKENPGNRENRFKFNRSQRSSTSALCATTQEGKCVICSKNHGLKSCVSFLSLPVKERFRKATSKGLCFRCLESGHRAEVCQKPPCKHCQGRHHSLLHQDSARPHLEEVKVESVPELPSPSSGPPVSSSVVANSVAVGSGGKVILQTVPAILCGVNGCSKVVRCFFDPGSQTSFVRQSVIDELGLNGKSVKIVVSGFGGEATKNTLRKRITFTVAPVDKSGQPQCIEALTTPVICRPAEAVDIHPARWSHLRNIVFPEEFPRDEQEIDVLIGLDFYYSFVTRDIVRGRSSEPVAVRTTLGWVFCGPTGGHDRECTVSMNVQIGVEEQLNETLQKFWDLESIGVRPAESSVSTTHVEDMVLKKFKETLTYNDGRYEVSLPWKKDRVALKDNYRQAESRLYNLEKKLLQEPMKATSYREAINKYVENGVAEEVPCDEVTPTDGRPVFYLPHHAVIREDKQTTKTRVVFDASAKDSNGVSLNSCLEPGPALQPDLVGIILRFRKNHVAIMGDIEKMFLQIRLKEEDMDSHRYLWRDLDPKATPKIYRMTRVTFGVVSSPFLAIGTIQEHVKRCKGTFPVASSEILRNTYVDDFASGRDNVQETLKLQQSATELMQKAAFNLTKWSSNSSELMDSLPERKSKASVSCVVQPKEPFIDFTRFSKYGRLLRTVAWIRRFVRNSRVKEEERIDSPLTGLEMQNAEKWLIFHVQEASFAEEITSSKRHGTVKDSNLANLNPFMCPTSGFLRVGGRIHKSLLPEEEKHPIILPSNNPVVKLLIDDVHRRELHAGVEHTLSVLRQKFWLIKGRSTVRQTLRNCLICRHYLTKPFGQRMAPLPEDRIKPAPPFTNVGLDFAGPLYLKDSGDKVYICLFTCAVTRAVHLELVCNMTTERFLLALRRMIARRGMCSIIWSDNAKTFKAANKELQQCWRVLESDQTQSALSEKKIQWKFIAEKAPWWGGFYERLVKSVKTPLKKLFAKAMLDAEQLTTILAEIEAQLNSRPLTYLGADPDDYSVITPAQILIGRNLQVCPTKDTHVSEQTSRALTKRFQYHQRLVNGFWKRWHAEYLKSLTPLKKWYKIGREIRKGDLVLVSEDRVARGQWSRARVEDTHTGRDGLVRSVTLRTSSGSVTRRPVQRLHLFEACDADIAAELN